jgi:hypothetical protein
MTKSLALDPHDPSSRGDLLPSRVGIPPRAASIIWNRNFPSLLSDPSTHPADFAARRAGFLVRWDQQIQGLRVCRADRPSRPTEAVENPASESIFQTAIPMSE